MKLPATALSDPVWLAGDLPRASRLHGHATPAVLGTIRWYSASQVLVGPALEPWVHSGLARDPSLDAVTFDMTADGRFLDAHSARPLSGDGTVLADALVRAIDAAATAISEVTGASARALWAVAVDSIATRLLWTGSATGDVPGAVRLAHELAERMAQAARELPGCRWNGTPRPRFESVGPHTVLRRSSCCLIYEAAATEGQKCVSCPRQPPPERQRRLHALLGP